MLVRSARLGRVDSMICGPLPLETHRSKRGILMKWFTSAVLAGLVVCGMVDRARAEEQDPKAILDKAIKALGGEEQLGKVKVYTWKAKAKFHFGENETEMAIQSTVQGLDHYRSEFEGKFGGNDSKGLFVLNGDKGWRKINEDLAEMNPDEFAMHKQTVYHSVLPTLLLPLKGDSFKLESAGEEKVGDKPAVGIKFTGADKKDFKIYFDKESGLPVKLVAKVAGFDGNEFTMDRTYSAYKDFGGVKKATKIESKRDGEKFFEEEVTEFKTLPEAAKGTFDEPK
jgi:hypothetical protein